MPDCTDWYTAIIVVLIAAICALVAKLNNSSAERTSDLKEFVMSDLRAATAPMPAGVLDSGSEDEDELETKLITNDGTHKDCSGEEE